MRCKYWNDMGHPEYHVNVNLSVVQLLQNDIVKKVAKVLEETRIIPQNLTLEVTESLAINDMVRMKKILSEIRNLGVRVALDDFGTGYSNLHCIRDMNPSYVKMDRDFTAKAMNSDRDYELYKNIIPMVHCINVRICAEGIEEKEWLLKMKEMKVDYLQGYYFGRPCGKEQFLQQYASGINVK